MHRNEVSARIAIIGAGFGGLGMLHALKTAGFSDVTVYEKRDDLGGVWRDNVYPGAACDVPSHLYSFSFAPGYPWSHRFARQPEILAYQHHCATQFDWWPHLRFGRDVSASVFDEAQGVWRLRMTDGEVIEADIVISAVGQLHRPAIPRIPGAERFTGQRFHSATWPSGFDATGRRIAVIGTGASAVQFVPEIAPQAAALHVFQRSPGWVLPREWVTPNASKPYSAAERARLQRLPWLERFDRARVYGVAEALAVAYNGNRTGEALIRRLCLRNLRRQVPDPALRAALTPDFPVGCKRILLTSNWLPTLTRPNVHLVTEGIAEITETGVRTRDGAEHAVDTLIYGTGFAATEFLTPMTVTGRNDTDLHTRWRDGAEAYLGMAVAGFPNFFMLYGPNTNVGSGSIIFMLECQQRFITQLLQRRAAQHQQTVEVDASAQRAYNDEMIARSARTSYAGSCQSWYKTADGRNTNNWVGTMSEFRRRTATPSADAFVLAAAESGAATT
jgi:cation diffusion facilitator CzcD-associated flavoprotein CzcO